jgi:hypothetical protein
MLHVLTILFGHHHALQNTTQVIELLVITRIRIVAIDGCVAEGVIVHYCDVLKNKI